MKIAMLKLPTITPIIKTKWLPVCLALLALAASPAFSQTAYFVDGWHGGIWGHYPPWVTQFLVDKLNQNPNWKINLEIEPESWDWIEANTPEAYKEFQALFADQSINSRIEYINPDFAQSYLWDVTGESVIRQFDYGMRKLRQHFPNANLTVYSSEEPCFTSALPGILKSFGFKYAVLKNPNTCWGGYTRAFGGELVNWVGPDGTKITTVPRYAIESLNTSTTWKTIASDNAPTYIEAALQDGIIHPVGMCLQDAGWKSGPRLGKGAYQPSEYVTWRDYFENHAVKTPAQDWKFSQEDVLVSLVWGSQVLQKIAQEVRAAENQITMSEKLATMAVTYQKFPWPQPAFAGAWRTLLLAEHHDCWITPYNRSGAADHLTALPSSLTPASGGATNNSWADKIALWTDNTRQTSDTITRQALASLSAETGDDRTFIRVFNTLGVGRNELAAAALPAGWDTSRVRVLDGENREVPSQIIPRSGSSEVLFAADVPSMGYNTYRLQKLPAVSSKGSHISIQTDGTYKLETDLYIVALDPAQGGTITSLQAKNLNHKEFVDGANARRFSEMRGYFFDEGKYHSSADQPAKLTILENGPVRLRVQVDGLIGIHPFTQTITLAQGQPGIDFNLKINWQGNPGIGDGYAQTNGWRREDDPKAFYNNREKLLALFPLNLQAQKIYKNAAFDVTESKLSDTFFNNWSGIKNDILLNWVDATDGSNQYGLALLTDHTTSYAHGADFPLGLTLQYSGMGLWGKNHRIAGPTELNYALVPHAGKWDQAGIWTASDRWNEPLVTSVMNSNSPAGAARKSLVSVSGSGIEICALYKDGNNLLARFFNAEGDAAPRQITFDGHADTIETVGLDGSKIRDLPPQKQAGQTTVSLSLAKLGVQTIRLGNFSASTSSE
jgi:alpha-mannosidase